MCLCAWLCVRASSLCLPALLAWLGAGFLTQVVSLSLPFPLSLALRLQAADQHRQHRRSSGSGISSLAHAKGSRLGAPSCSGRRSGVRASSCAASTGSARQLWGTRRQQGGAQRQEWGTRRQQGVNLGSRGDTAAGGVVVSAPSGRMRIV